MASKYVIITGTSSGIGKALAQLFLREGYNVIGVSRRNVLTHERFTFVKVDLSDRGQLESFNLPNIENAASIYLINNAASLGNIGFAGSYDLNESIATYMLNVVAPIHLSNLFIRKFEKLDCPKVILNISSGAAKNPVFGWGNYCSSKAALNMFSEVVAGELEQNSSGIKIFALAPGIVDTEMQNQIRSSKKEDFPRVAEFVNYKNNNELSDPQLVSQKIFDILLQADNIPQTVISLRDY